MCTLPRHTRGLCVRSGRATRTLRWHPRNWGWELRERKRKVERERERQSGGGGGVLARACALGPARATPGATCGKASRTELRAPLSPSRPPSSLVHSVYIHTYIRAYVHRFVSLPSRYNRGLRKKARLFAGTKVNTARGRILTRETEWKGCHLFNCWAESVRPSCTVSYTRALSSLQRANERAAF